MAYHDTKFTETIMKALITQAWKNLAHNKSNTLRHHVQRALLIGMMAADELEDQVRVAQIVLEKGLTPITSKKKLANGRSAYDCYHRIWPKPTSGDLLGVEDLIPLEKRAQLDLIWQELIKQHGRIGVHYSFIFLFGDLMPEQRCIQMAHAAMKMGQRLTQENAWPQGVSSDNLHYAMVTPGKGPYQINRQLHELGIQSIQFEDHDYTFGPDGTLIESPGTSIKAIMTYPIHHSKRAGLQEFELYRFEQPTSQ